MNEKKSRSQFLLRGYFYANFEHQLSNRFSTHSSEIHSKQAAICCSYMVKISRTFTAQLMRNCGEKRIEKSAFCTYAHREVKYENMVSL